MSVIVDAGALVALERGDRGIWEVLKDELAAGRPVVTHAGVIAEIWRGGSGRQARLARALEGIDVRPIDDDLGRRAGVLLGRAGTADVIDAALVLLAQDDDEILTGDAGDLRSLADATGRAIDLIEI